MTSAFTPSPVKIGLAALAVVGLGGWLFYSPAQPLAAASSARAHLLAQSPAPAFPSVSATDATLLQLARARVARSPASALAWAQSIPDPVLRQRTLLALAAAWGEVDPAAASTWALNQDPEDLRQDLQAALTGATRQSPGAAAQIGRDLLTQNSPYAGAFGTALLSAFGANGQFAAAVQFADAAPADYREDWLASGFRQWAAQQPAQAFSVLDSVADPAVRDTVTRAAVQGAAAGQPAALANYALALPEGDDRAYALDQTLFQWSRQDPAALATWLANMPSGQNFDNAAFFILTENDPVALGPTNALNWAQSIGDPGLRQTSFAHVLNQWSQADPAAVHHYLQTVPGLTAADRSALLQNLPAP